MIIEKIADIQRLTSKEKAILAKELWAEVGDLDLRVSGDLGHSETVGARWNEFLKDPESAVSWRSVREKMEKRIQDDRRD